jgi:hypothetical protein
METLQAFHLHDTKSEHTTESLQIEQEEVSISESILPLVRAIHSEKIHLHQQW